MEFNAAQIESIVRKLVTEMSAGASAPKDVPAKAQVAMLTAAKKIEIKEFPIPALEDDDILVKVEGCGVCGTDVHEWKGDPLRTYPRSSWSRGNGRNSRFG